MREILFRAKRTDNGEWAEGYLVETRHNTYHDGYRIIDKDGINYDELDYYEPSFISYVIDKTTICQCTGLKDKNGNLIWENDVVKCVDVNAETEFFAVVEFGNPNGFYSWGYQLKHIYGDEPNLDILLWIDMEKSGAFCDVIGNIFDEGSENIGKGAEEN